AAGTPAGRAPARPGAPVAGAVADDGQRIPAEARFTIYCNSFTSADHVNEATQMKKVLMANTNLKDWYVIHQDGQSTLYHGYYREFDPKLEGLDAAAKR